MPSLDEMLATLHTDETRKDFLRQIYTPGNATVADHLLALGPDHSVLAREIDYALEHGPRERFETLAKQEIDHFARDGQGTPLQKRVLGWNDPALGVYALEQLGVAFSSGENLTAAAEIALAFGRREQAEILWARLLPLQMMNVSGSHRPAAETLVKLGRHREAIDIYLSGNSRYSNYGHALSIAREHLPDQVNFIANAAYIGRNRAFDFETGDVATFLECAELLGHREDAREIILHKTKDIDPKYPPRMYQSLVKALLKLSEWDVASVVVSSIARHQSAQRGNQYAVEVGELWALLGDDRQLEEGYRSRVVSGLQQSWKDTMLMRDIEEGYAIRNNLWFLEQKMQIFEREGRYLDAASIARQMGKEETAVAYDAMAELVTHHAPILPAPPLKASSAAA